MNKSISDEKIIACLLAHDTRKAAATALGIKQDTLTARMKAEAFQERYKEAKDNLIKDTVTSLQTRMQEAIKVIADVMNNTSNSPQIRINAADIILRYTVKLTETEELITRIEELEEICRKESEL